MVAAEANPQGRAAGSGTLVSNILAHLALNITKKTRLLRLAIVEAVDVKLILIANRLMEVDVNANETLGEKWEDVVQWHMEWTLNSF